MEEFTKSLPRLNKTKGTRAYSFRNYVGLTIIGCGLISGFAFYSLRKLKTENIEIFDEKEHELKKARLTLPFSVGPRV